MQENVILAKLLCPNMEIQPHAPKNDIFQKQISFFWKGLQTSLPTSPQPSPAKV